MNRHIRFVIGLLIVVGMVGASYLTAAPPPADIEVRFSPRGGCTEAIVAEIGKAQREFLMQGYSFTSMQIAQAIARAYGRGVKVSIVLDQSQFDDKSAALSFLLSRGVKVYSDDKHAIAHNKVMIIDSRTVITGSFNFTVAAEKDNAENLLIMRRPDLSLKYVANFDEHLKHSELAK